MTEQQQSGPTAPPGPTAPSTTSQRTAYGVRSAVEKAQSVIPDEPVEAVLQVRRPWTIALVIAVAVLGVQLGDRLLPGRRHGVLAVAAVVVAVVAVLLAWLWLRDRMSGLSLGNGETLLAVTATRVLVVRVSPWPSGRRSIVLALDRAERPVSQIETSWSLRTVAVALPSQASVLLRVFQGQRAAHRAALPMVVGPPGSCWGQHPDDPPLPQVARLWTPAGWTDTTIPLRDLDLAKVPLAPVPA